MHVHDHFGEEIEKLEKEGHFKANCYEVEISLCGQKGISHILAEILGSGTGRNLIRSDALPRGSTHYIRKFHTPLWSAGDSIFYVDGAITLGVELGRYDTHGLFGVALTLGTKAILDMSLISKHVRCI